MALVIVGAVLGPVVRAGVGGVSVWTIWLLGLLLMVNRHQVLHVHRVLAFLVSPDAHGGQAEEDGGDEGEADSNPGHNVAPFVLEGGVLKQIRVPGLDKELGVGFSVDLVALPVFDSVPETHPASGEEAGDEHEDGGGRDVGGGRLPAAADTGGEGDEHEEEADDEKGDHGTVHICKS